MQIVKLRTSRWLKALLLYAALFLQPGKPAPQSAPTEAPAVSDALSPSVDEASYARTMTHLNFSGYVLRFTPSTGQELQIVIPLGKPSGRTICSVYRPARGNEFDVPGNGASNAAAGSGSRVRVDRVEVSAKEAAVWGDSFFPSVSRSETKLQTNRREWELYGKRYVSLDGSLYRLWYSDFDTVQYWRILGGGLQERPSFSAVDDLTDWMNTVRCLVTKKLPLGRN